MRTEQMPPLLRHLVALFLPFSTCDHFEQLVSVHPPPPPSHPHLANASPSQSPSPPCSLIWNHGRYPLSSCTSRTLLVRSISSCNPDNFSLSSRGNNVRLHWHQESSWLTPHIVPRWWSPSRFLLPSWGASIYSRATGSSMHSSCFFWYHRRL